MEFLRDNLPLLAFLCLVILPILRWVESKTIGRSWVNESDGAKRRIRYAELFLSNGTSIAEMPKTAEEAKTLKWSLSLEYTQLQDDLQYFQLNYNQESEIEFKIHVRNLNISVDDYHKVVTEFNHALMLINSDLARVRNLRFDNQENFEKLPNIGGEVQLVMDGGRVAAFRFSRMPEDLYTLEVRGHVQQINARGDFEITAAMFGLLPIASSQLTIESMDGKRDEIHW